MPRSLTEGCKRKRMACDQFRICLVRPTDVGQQTLIKQLTERLYGLEGAHPSQYLAAVITGHPHGRDLPRLLVDVKVCRIGYAGAPISQVYGPFRVAIESRKKFLPDPNDLMRLPTSFSDLSRQ